MNKFSVILEEEQELEPSKTSLTFFCPTCNKRMNISNACCHNMHVINDNSYDQFQKMLNANYTFADEARELAEERKQFQIKVPIRAHFQVNKNNDLITGAPENE